MHQLQQHASRRLHCHHVLYLWMGLSHDHGLDLVTNFTRLAKGIIVHTSYFVPNYTYIAFAIVKTIYLEKPKGSTT
jgi:hypothetical protein